MAVETINIDFSNLSPEDRKAFLSFVKKGKGKRVVTWKPRMDEEYFYVTDCGDIDSTDNEESEMDEYLISVGNCYKTEEAAEKRNEYLLIRQIMKDYADEHNEYIDWRDRSQFKYYMILPPDTGEVAVASTCAGFTPETVYFSSEALCKEAINKVGVKRIIQYLSLEGYESLSF